MTAAPETEPTGYPDQWKPREAREREAAAQPPDLERQLAELPLPEFRAMLQRIEAQR